MAERFPLLVVSDAVTGPTGFARITREVVARIYANLGDVIDVATAGYGGTSSKRFPWPQYTFNLVNGWTIPELPRIWKDHAGDREGAIWFFWNQSWLGWFSYPEHLPQGELRDFLTNGRFKRWGYFPVDSVGIDGKLSADEKKIFERFDRILAYTEFGASVISATLNGKRIDHCPHGTDVRIFYPRDRHEARANLLPKIAQYNGIIDDSIKLLAVVGTNTRRKNWPLAFEIAQGLLKRGFKIGTWCHTDAYLKEWNLYALADAYGLQNRVMFTNSQVSDDDMAWGYAASDLLLCPSTGEGWGLSGSEALACGVPVLHGNYAGQAEYMPKELLVEPVGYFVDSPQNLRPVFDAKSWVDKAEMILTQEQERKSLLDPKYYWENCWTDWEKWLRAGIEKTASKVSTGLKMDYIVATVYQPKWRESVRTWMETEKSPHGMTVIPHKGVVDAYQEGFEKSKADILAYIHDDVLIFEKDWDQRVLKEFEDPQVGLVGFLGAKAHGDPELYKKPYQLSQLGRSGVVSNMKEAEKHGERIVGSCDVAVLDAFAMFVRREILEKAGGWPVSTEIDYLCPDYWLSCMIRRLGYRIRVVGVNCQHLSGGSNARNVKPIDFEGAHRYIFENFRDVLPFRVEAQ